MKIKKTDLFLKYFFYIFVCVSSSLQHASFSLVVAGKLSSYSMLD